MTLMQPPKLTMPMPIIPVGAGSESTRAEPTGSRKDKLGRQFQSHM